MPEPLFNKVAGRNFIKEETLAHVFSSEFCEIPKKTFFTEHLWATASAYAVLSVYSALSVLSTPKILIFLAPIPQNGQTHSNNSNCLSVFAHFVKLALKGLLRAIV